MQSEPRNGTESKTKHRVTGFRGLGLKVSGARTGVRGWYSRLCSSIVVSPGVRHYGGKVDVLDLTVVFGWGFYVGWLWAKSTPPKRSLEEMKADLDAYSGRFEPHDSAGEKPKE